MGAKQGRNQGNDPHDSQFEERFSRLIELLSQAQLDAQRGQLTSDRDGEDESAYAMVGAWLSDKARSINAGLRRGAGDGATRASLIGQAKDLFGTLAELSEAMRGDEFKSFSLQGMKFSDDEAKALMDEIADLGQFSRDLAMPLASEDAGESRIGALRESPTWRQAVRNGMGRKIDDQSFFAPLLDCIVKEASPALRAEMTAKMELYILSGHARADCAAPEAGASKGAAKMHGLCARLRADPDSVKDAMKVINGRFNEVFLRAIVEQSIDEEGEVTSVARIEGRRKTGAGKLAEAGAIDAVIRDARDPSIVHMAIATADPSNYVEKDQAFRHHKAISDAVRAGVVEGASAVSLSYYLPCLFYDEASETGRELGESFLSSMKDRLTPEERQTLNVLPFLSAIARVDRNHPNFKVEALADFDLRLIGAKSDSWTKAMQGVRSIADPSARREAFLAAAAAKVSDAIDVFAKKSADESKLRSGNSNRPLLASLCECLEGLNKHGIDHPVVLRPVAANLDRLRALRANCGMEGDIRGRLASAMDPHAFPGGYGAWASNRLEGELEEQRIALRARIGQQMESAANKVMVRMFVEEVVSKGALGPKDLDALRANLNADARMVQGFSEGDRKELDALLAMDPSRARDMLRARATEELPKAARGGDIQRLHGLVRHGADICQVDDKGRDAVAIAKTAGHADAAAYLEVARDKQCVERILAKERAERLSSEAIAQARRPHSSKDH